MRNVLSNRYWPIGLDIGSDGIRMLQLRRVGPSIAVAACGRWWYPEHAADAPGSSGGDTTHRRKAAVKAVRGMLRRGDFHGCRVVTALSCRELGMKNIRLPHMVGAEQEKAVRREAKERFGFDVAPDQLRYLVAGQVRSGDETYDEIIMMVVPGETIEQHLALVQDMGLRVEHIEAAPVALFRVFERYLRRRADEEAVIVVADMGASGTRVVVARGKQIVFVKRIDIGGRRLTEAVARQLNLTNSEARELRMRVAKPQQRADSESGDKQSELSSVDWTVHDAVRGEVENLAREMAMCLRYCSVTFRGLRPQRMMLTGGEVYDASLVRLLGEQLALKCEVGHPLKGIDVSAVDIDWDRRGMLAEWAMCTGLAIRDVDFATTGREVKHAEHRLSA